MKSNSLSPLSETTGSNPGRFKFINESINDNEWNDNNGQSRSWTGKYLDAENGSDRSKQSSSHQNDNQEHSLRKFKNHFEIPSNFCEMEILTKYETELEWNESARWIKFEENVEKGGNRWSKPYVGTLSLHSIHQLNALLMNGILKFNMDAHSWEAITNIICQNLVNNGTLQIEVRDKLRNVLLRPHRHQYELRGISNSKMDTRSNYSSGKTHSILNASSLATEHSNKRFLRKIPPGAEASNILIGEVEFLEKPLSVFIRLRESKIIGNLTEVPIPTRFIYILLGPKIKQFNYPEIGRSIATLLSDDVFREYAYHSQKPEHLQTGIDEFLRAVFVLPPGVWDPNIRIEPPPTIPSQQKRKQAPYVYHNSSENLMQQAHSYEDSGLVRTGRLFGGLVNDIKRKAPWYWSDFKDAMNIQCVASYIFLYFACLSPIITFGGLLSEATGKNIAAIESLVSGFICGIGYGLFSGQPLAILGSTGPVLVFESIVYEYCQNQGWDYMTFRFWIGTWIAIILLLLTAFDASASVCYITRFTEENFATLIAFIFIYKAIENVALINDKYPMDSDGFNCICVPPNDNNETFLEYTKYNRTFCQISNGTLIGTACETPQNVNVFPISVILFLGTFSISVILKDFKNALFFPTIVRQFISDFSVIIAIFAMSILDYSMHVETPKLEVPSQLKPTLSTRGWLIPPFSVQNPYWTPFIAVIPALLGTILIFMDQQITAVIINRRENKLKKGCGYHLDLFILAILIEICSIMGLPWFVAATVLSLNHVNSLKKESECSAPGEKPQFLGVHEQRLTQILIFLTIGFSVVLTPLLAHIPMPVLFGVFLYMGVSSLKGLQFFDRILIMFMPAKYQPDYPYLRQVPIRRVHLFTFIQLTCLIALWVIKSFSKTSILFPIMLLVMIGIRKALDKVFTQQELMILDDIMPGMSKNDMTDPKSPISGENLRSISVPVSVL